MRGNKAVVHRTLRLVLSMNRCPVNTFPLNCHRIRTQWNTLNTKTTKPTVGLGKVEVLKNLNTSQSLYGQALLISLFPKLR